MLFVHLTDVKMVPRIRQNGLRLGWGRRGTGLYCVPLIELGTGEPGVVSSTGGQWKWWIRGRGARRPAAVVFSAPAFAWPADLYVNIDEGVVEPEFVKTLGAALRRVGAENMWACEFGCVRVDSPAHLGKVLAAYRKAGARIGAHGSDSIEVVFQCPMPSRQIQKIIPLNQTNRKFKERRRTSGVDCRDHGTRTYGSRRKAG